MDGKPLTTGESNPSHGTAMHCLHVQSRRCLTSGNHHQLGLYLQMAAAPPGIPVVSQ